MTRKTVNLHITEITDPMQAIEAPKIIKAPKQPDLYQGDVMQPQEWITGNTHDPAPGVVTQQSPGTKSQRITGEHTKA